MISGHFRYLASNSNAPGSEDCAAWSFVGIIWAASADADFTPVQAHTNLPFQAAHVTQVTYVRRLIHCDYLSSMRRSFKHQHQASVSGISVMESLSWDR
jgi:hypothetical protein